ncbi:hypothetical protein HRI_002412500 [Hibiscus trionum]|uniref:Polyprotein n=1 Tax=Hibiscus trionum TaxID=183268 RepID=A0A9W7I265_HIBTR|nr:hypothetical protein HRI_002412500 [Hibiscus trionum]
MAPSTDSARDNSDPAVQMFSNKRINVCLDDTNFLLWKQQVILTVRGLRLEAYLDPEMPKPSKVLQRASGERVVNPDYTAYVKQDSSLASWLLSTVSSDLLPQLVGAETSAEIWNVITGLYSKLSTTKVMHLHCKLRSMKKGGMQMREYTVKIKEICDLLSLSGHTVSDVEKNATILNGLPAEYAPFVAVVTASREPYTLEGVITVLVDAESRLGDQLDSPVGIHLSQYQAGDSGNRSGYIASDRGRGFRSGQFRGGRFRGRARPQCQICGKLGHFADSCWHRFDEQYKGTSSQQSHPADAPQANNCQYQMVDDENGYEPFVDTTVGTANEPDIQQRSDGAAQVNALTTSGVGSSSAWWYPDSGATHHVTHSKSLLHSALPYVGHGRVHLGDNTTVSIANIGNAAQPALPISSCDLVLNKVLHVPQISRNLLSVSRCAADNDIFFEFHSTECFVKDEKTGKVLLKGIQEEGLYCFPPPPHATESFTVHHTTTNKDTAAFWLWHKRLGHPSPEVLHRVVGSSVCLDRSKVCDACQLGKAHAQPFKSSRTVYSSPFELVEMDVWGPAPLVSAGFSYYISFVDMFSRCCWVYLLRNKSEVVYVFEAFVALVKNQFSSVIKAVQTDGGGEFRAIVDKLNSLGIQHRITCPHTSQQNGVVERRHRQIVETALCLLAQAAAPLKFWSYAVLSATYLINRLPTPVLGNISPLEKLTGKQPDYSFLRVFGCACYPYLRPYNKHKLDFRSQRCVFLGYSPKYRGYQCLGARGRIYISRHVKFDETSFPFQVGVSTDLEPRLESFRSQPVPVLSPSYEQPVTVENDPFVAQEAAEVDNALPTKARDVGTDSHAADFDTIATIPDDTENATAEGNETLAAHGTPRVDDEISTPQVVPTNKDVHLPSPNTLFPDTESHAPRHASSSLGSDIPPSFDGFSTAANDEVADSESRVQGNTHTMITRSKHGIFKPKLYLVDCEGVPRTIHEAMDSVDWRQAVLDEFTALIANGTWTLVPAPAERKIIGCKWLFKIKRNADGSISRYKARLVAKGYSQVPGHDFKDTFSPVVKSLTINVLISLAVLHKWKIHQVDINNAFLKGDLHEVVYMQQPPGFEQTDSNGNVLVCKLEKALYGLRQAPRSWFLKLKGFLLSLQFKCSLADTSLFVYKTDAIITYVIIYVDDILISGSSKHHISLVKQHLHEQFSLKDLGQLDYFLGMQATTCADGLFLSQRKYVFELLQRTQMQDARPADTPMAVSPKLSRYDSEPFLEVAKYRSIVGALLYVCHTRPDIAYAVNRVAQYMQTPTVSHWKAVKRVLRYLKGTLEFGLWFPVQVSTHSALVAFSDADWGSDEDDRRSISGYCVYYGNHLLSWSSKKQRSVSRSTAEAEYRSLADATSEVMWVRNVLVDMHVALAELPKIWCDNTSTIAMAANPVMHAKTKHVDLDLHFVRERVLGCMLQVGYVPANSQVADVMTKPLNATQFEFFRTKLNVVSIEDLRREKSRVNVS